MRQAGISERDEAFMDNFSEEMIQKKNEKSKQNLAQEKSKEGSQIYQPSDEEINEKLAKAKNMNKKIFQNTHPEEYKKLLQKESEKKQKELAEKKKQEEKDKQYRDMVKSRMTQLQEEVN